MKDKIIISVLAFIFGILLVGWTIAIGCNWTEADQILQEAERGETLFFTHNLYGEKRARTIGAIQNSPNIFWADYQDSEIKDFGNIQMIRIFKNKNKDKGSLIQKRTEEAISDISPDMTDLEKVKAINDWICENVEYVWEDCDQTIVGAMIDGKTRCGGYAKVFTYLLEKVGIKSKIIVGYADVPDGRFPHAWNVVTIDGEETYFDLSWDDGKNPTYEWFNMDYEEFSKTHKEWTAGN